MTKEEAQALVEEMMVYEARMAEIAEAFDEDWCPKWLRFIQRVVQSCEDASNRIFEARNNASLAFKLKLKHWRVEMGRIPPLGEVDE